MSDDSDGRAPRWAICNEIFEDRPLADAFAQIAKTGYAAVELAPYTLGDAPTRLTAGERSELRSLAADLGLGFTGMHWLLAGTEGLHVSAADPDRARRTLSHLRELSYLCAELGGEVLVFGSPNQRSTPEGMERGEARERATTVFAAWGETAAELGVTICLEALPPNETDFMTTTAEVVDIVTAIGSPAVQLVLDVKSMSSEGVSIPSLIELAAPHLRYVQANDANRSGPGFGDTDFVPIFRTLKAVGYRGDVSVEAFDFSAGTERVAQGSIDYLRASALAAGWP